MGCEQRTSYMIYILFNAILKPISVPAYWTFRISQRGDNSRQKDSVMRQVDQARQTFIVALQSHQQAKESQKVGLWSAASFRRHA